MRLSDLRKSVFSEATSEASLEQHSHEFSRLLWDQEGLPGPFLDLVLETLTLPKLYSKAGIWHFLFELGGESYRLDQPALDRIREAIVSTYAEYSDPMLRQMVCDFVAQHLPPDQALDCLQRIAELEDSSSERYSLVGLEILLASLDEGDPLRARAAQMVQRGRTR